MATWLDRLHECSLGDVKLVHRSSRWTFGREHRVVAYPYQDVSDSEAMGRPPEELDETVEVIGDDFDLAVLRLRYLLDGSQPLIYTHPIWGPFKVRPSQRTSAGYDGNGGNNAATIQLQLTRVDDAVPTPVEVPKEQVDLAAGVVYTTSQAQFAKDFDANLGFAELVDAVRNGIGDATMFLAGVNGKIASKIGIISTLSQDLFALEQQFKTLVNTPTALASAIVGLVLQGKSMFWSVVNAPKSIEDQFKAIKELATPEKGGQVVPTQSDDADSFAQTPASHAAIVLGATKEAGSHTQEREGLPDTLPTKNRVKEGKCYDALETLVRVAGVAGYASMATGIQWSSRREAKQFRKDIVAEIKAVRARDGVDADTIAALTGLISQMEAYLESAARQAVETEDYELQADRPLLLAAYDRYGDITRGFELYQRNGDLVSDPGMVSSGTVLEAVRG